MKKLSIASLFLLLIVKGTLFASSSETFDRFFLDKTLRVDYYHTGTKGFEVMSLDNIYEEAEWPGSKINLLDTMNLGE